MRIGLLSLLLMGALFLVCSCGQDPVSKEGAPLDITLFSFTHTASNMEDCYRMEVSLQDGGTRLCAEELFLGGRVVDTMVEEPLLKRLGELAGTYRIDRWDGFDKSRSRVLDGSTFTLRMVLADGSEISAHGSNAFPDNYSDAASAFRSLYTELMDRYGHAGTEPAANSNG